MKKLIIKIPIKKENKWSLQQTGILAKRFKTPTSLLNHLKRSFPQKEFDKRLAIIVKRYVGSSPRPRCRWENINETLSSKDPKYLLYTITCFLEDYLSSSIINKVTKNYLV